MLRNAYSVKSVSSDAVISCVLGGISIVFMIGAVVASYMYSGTGPTIVGLLGMGSLIMALSGMGFSVAAWKSQDGGFLMKRVAMLVNVLPLAIAVILYIVGWFV